MRSGIFLPAICVVLLCVSGCGSGGNSDASTSAPNLPAADLTIHLFNSVGKPIRVVVVDSQPGPDSDPKRTAFDLKSYGHAKYPCRYSETLQFKIIGPPGLERHNQSVDVPAAGTQKGDVLLDFGARTTFYQYPMFYVPAKDAAKWKVPEETQQKFPLKKLSGPAARYDLTFKAIGINKGMKLFEQNSQPPDKGSVYMSILTESTLRRVKSGEDLNFIERDEN